MNLHRFIIRAGYFTWLSMLYGRNPAALEAAIGYAGGSLHNGWSLFTPRVPISATNIDLRGSTRYSDGVMTDGRRIADVLAGRLDVGEARRKVVNFFDRGLDRRPVKVFVDPPPASYPPAVGIGIAQFQLIAPVEWVFVLEVAPGALLTRSMAMAAKW